MEKIILQVYSYGKSRRIGELIEVCSTGIDGIVAVGKIEAITPIIGGAVILSVRLVAGK